MFDACWLKNNIYEVIGSKGSLHKTEYLDTFCSCLTQFTFI